MGFIVKAVKSVVKAVVGVVSKVVGGVFGFLVGGKKSTAVAKAVNTLNKSLDPEAFKKIVFGRIAAPLDVRYWEVYGPNAARFDEVIALAGHRINAALELYMESEVGIDAAGNPQGKYAGGTLTRDVRLGAPNQTAMAVGAGGQWTAASTFDGVPHMLLRWLPDEKKLPNGIPSRYTQVVEGALVYDPRRDSTVPGGAGTHRINDRTTWEYSTLDGNGVPIGRNNALQTLWYLLGWTVPTKDANGNVTGEAIVCGRGVDPEDINLSTFIAGANNCEIAGYYTDMVLSTEDTHTANEDKITCAGLIGRLIDPGGLWSYYANVNDTANIAVELTDADIIQGQSVSWNEYEGMADQFNQVTGKYINPSPLTLFQAFPYPMVRDAVYEANLGVKRRKPQDFEQVLDGTLAQRLARLFLNQGQYQGEFGAAFNYRAVKAQAWSVVRYTSERFGFVKLFRVWRHDIDTFQGVSMLLKEIDPSIWSAGTVNPPLAPGLGTAYEANQEIPLIGLAVANVTISGQGTNTNVYDGGNVTWDAPSIAVRRTEVRYRVVGTTYWETSASVERGTATNALIYPLVKGTHYQVQARHVSIHEVEGPWIEWPDFLSGTNGNVDYQGIVTSGITAQWPYVGDPTGTRPENNATVGAPVGTNVAGMPAQTLVGNVNIHTATLSAQGLQLSDILVDISDLYGVYGDTASAEASAAAAAASLASTLTAKTLAEQAKTQSETARNDAQAANTAAQAAQALASGSASTASQAMTNAQTALSFAVEARNQASGFATDAYGWADAASGSASSASASASLSGQKADAANASAILADTSRTQAQVSQSAAAASESNAANAAASAALSQSITASAAFIASGHSNGNLCGQSHAENGSNIAWSPGVTVLTEGMGNGFTKAFRSQQRDAVCDYVQGNFAGRKLRISALITTNYTNITTRLGVFAYKSDMVVFPSFSIQAPGTGGWYQRSGLIEIGPEDQVIGIRGWVGQETSEPNPAPDVRWTNFVVEDITESLAALNSASASAASASQASASQTEALNQAQASQTARIAAEAAKDAASGSASAASGSASQASASATLSGQKADAANASALQADTSRAQAQAAQTAAAASESSAAGSASSASQSQTLAAQAYGNANDAAILSAGFRDQSQAAASASASSASSAAASQSDAAQKASAAETSRLAAETARGGAESARDQSVNSSNSASGSASTATSQASLSATARSASEKAAGRQFVGNFTDELTYWEWTEQPAPTYNVFGPGYGFQAPDKTMYFNTPPEHYLVFQNKYVVPSALGRRWLGQVPYGVYHAQNNSPNSYVYFRVVSENGAVYYGASKYWTAGLYNVYPTIEFVTTDASALRVQLIFFSGDGLTLSNAIHDITFVDITEQYNANLSAMASAVSASQAAASQSDTAQKAQAAEASRVAAETAKGAAEAARNQAAVSESNAAGSASAASASQTLSANSVRMAGTHATGNLVGQSEFEDGVNRVWIGGANYVVTEGVGGGFTKVLVSQVRDIYANYVTGNFANRKLRVSARVCTAYTNLQCRIGAIVAYADNSFAYPGINAPAAGSGGWYDISGVIDTGPGVIGLRGWANQETFVPNPIIDFRFTNFILEDVTEQLAALAQASAAATSASQAAAAQTASGQNANASEASKVAAQTAQGYAESARDQSASSASGAAGSASVAAQNATLSATYGSSSNNLIPDTDFRSLQAPGWAGYTDNSVAGFAAQVFHRVGTNPFWSANIPGLEIEQQGEIQGVFSTWFNTMQQIIPNEWYIGSVRIAAHRCNVDMVINFYDVNGNYISGVSNPTGAQGWGSGSTGVAAMLRLQAKAQAPANARYARLELVKFPTYPGQGGSWGWFIQPQISQVRAGVNEAPPFVHGNGGGLSATVNATVSSQSAAIATLQGRVLAYWQQTVNANIGNGASAFLQLLAEGSYGAGVTSQVAMGAREIHLYNQSVTGEYSRALSVIAGRVTIFGDLDVGGAMRFGLRRIPVALQSFSVTANDGQSISFGGDLTNVPKIEPQIAGLPALPSGQSYDVKALSLTSTGFTARQKIVTQGTPSNQNSGAGVDAGNVNPKYRAHKPSAGDAVDGNYNYFVSGTVQMYVYGSYQDFEFGNTINIYVDCYVKRGGNWQAIGSLYTSVSSYGQYGSGMQTFGWDASGGVYCADAIGQDSGADYEFGIDVYTDNGNVASVSFGGVTYQAQGTQTAESAIPQAITYRVIPQNG